MTVTATKCLSSQWGRSRSDEEGFDIGAFTIRRCSLVNSVVRLTTGGDPQPSPIEVFAGTDGGEKRTQRHARLHGNAANKTARISSGRCQVRRPSYIYLFRSKQLSSWFGARGGKISPKKHKAKSKKYLGRNKSFGISME